MLGEIISFIIFIDLLLFFTSAPSIIGYLLDKFL
jgi:hypothetical protein